MSTYKQGTWTAKNGRQTVAEHLSRPAVIKMFKRGDIDEYNLEDVVYSPTGEEIGRVAGDDVFDWFQKNLGMNMFDALQAGFVKKSSHPDHL